MLSKSKSSLCGDSQGQETFLAPSADKQTRNYDTRVLKPPSLPINIKVKGIEPLGEISRTKEIHVQTKLWSI